MNFPWQIRKEVALLGAALVGVTNVQTINLVPLSVKTQITVN